MTGVATLSPMRGGAAMGLNLPRRTPRYRFSMTPLADVLFQLLIFFMLSSNIVPYSMLTIRSGALQGQAAAGQEVATPQRVTDATATAVWTLRPDGLVAGGQRFGFDDLSALGDALAIQGTQNVLLVLRPEVAIQQVTTVLETLAARGIESVQIAGAETR